MTLKELRETYYIYTGKLSDLTRQLSFAGIAVVWIFRTSDNKSAGLLWDAYLLLPLTLFVAALICDMLQYCYASIAWGVFHRTKEKEFQMRQTSGASNLDEFKAPPAINWPSLFFFWTKTLFAGAGHFLLLKHLAAILY